MCRPTVIWSGELTYPGPPIQSSQPHLHSYTLLFLWLSGLGAGSEDCMLGCWNLSFWPGVVGPFRGAVTRKCWLLTFGDWEMVRNGVGWERSWSGWTYHSGRVWTWPCVLAREQAVGRWHVCRSHIPLGQGGAGLCVISAWRHLLRPPPPSPQPVLATWKGPVTMRRWPWLS